MAKNLEIRQIFKITIIYQLSSLRFLVRYNILHFLPYISNKKMYNRTHTPNKQTAIKMVNKNIPKYLNPNLSNNNLSLLTLPKMYWSHGALWKDICAPRCDRIVNTLIVLLKYKVKINHSTYVKKYFKQSTLLINKN